ncbi:LysR family transcriptional regulator [Pokkaliibacter plantistimulans]|uniref:LysR family transcriptional regulator n=1 Tax=Proteobacteria bacterium 228 TaxID=2083153 RepID=A0A2S5KGR5_9PROT|nr:LysR substrate-binding domain-containing protein [Pokkaliibacter plantistimulans]PPC73997.1 LysR family transcriptional regulator [Pokkaliibacter plantistimulans]
MSRLPSLAALRMFDVACRYMNLTKAADVLNLTQGAVSRQIKQLEEELGQPLFNRHHHGLTLTDQGEQLLPQVRAAFELLEEAVTGVKTADPRQQLRLATPPTYATRWLAPRLRQLRRQFPHLQLSIQTELQQRQAHYDHDCRIRFGNKPAAGCFSELLFRERHIAVVNAEFADWSVQRLFDEHPLLHVLDGQKRLRLWEPWLAAAGLTHINPRDGIEFSTLDQVINMTLAGEGLAVIDRHMISRELQQGTLVPVCAHIEVEGELGYWLDISHSRMGLSKITAFSQWLRAVTLEAS